MNEVPESLMAIAWAYRSETAATICYGVTAGFGLAGFILAAYGHTFPAVILGAVAFVTAILGAMAFVASRRWRSYAESLDREASK